MRTHSLESYTSRVTDIFRKNESHYRSHEMSREVLKEMAHDPLFFKLLLQKHLSNPKNYNRPNFPLPGMTLAETPYYTCYVHFWFGEMPQFSRGQSVTCVHHHGTLLLTTLAVHGPGCEVWIFARPRETAVDGIFQMEQMVQHQNTPGSFTFVDTGQPHLIFPPKSFSVTIALWSYTRSRFIDALRGSPVVRRHKQTFLKLSRMARLTKTLQINEVVNFDFIPLEKGFKASAERLQYSYAANEDYLVNLFHILQETRNEESVATVREVLQKKGDLLKNRLLVETLADRTERGEMIGTRVSEPHRFVPRLNVTRNEVLRAL